MDHDDELKSDLIYSITSHRPNIIQVELYSQLHHIDGDAVRSVMERLSENSQQEVEEERLNTVYQISGFAHNPQLNRKMKVVKLVNGSDVEKVKSTLESVLHCVLYGAYRGTRTNPAKLSLEQFEGETTKYSISLPADTSPDGNCKKSSGIRQRPSSPQPSTSGVSTHPQATKPVSQGAKASTHSKKSSSHGNKTNKFQPKLFFAQTNSSKSQSADSSSVTSKHSNVSQPEEKVGTSEDSPNKSSDKENSAKQTKESKTKRSRLQMFSSSESESEAEIVEDSRAKKRTKKADNSQNNGKPVINKTGLVLDPEDLQNESDGDSSDDPTSSKKSPAEVEKVPRKRRRTKKEADGEQAEGGNSKKSKQINYGAVKAGSSCNEVKYVDRTYLDDEGFLVTEKVLEEIPQSERKEQKVESKQPAKKVEHAPSKKSKPVPTQQSSLLNFFKKK